MSSWIKLKRILTVSQETGKRIIPIMIRGMPLRRPEYYLSGQQDGHSSADRHLAARQAVVEIEIQRVGVCHPRPRA